MRLALAASVLALTGGAALILIPRALRAADEAPRDVVERLMPQLLGDDDATRADAEKKLFALGEPGRAEMERMTRDSDPRRAVTALRLLQSKAWTKTAKQQGVGELRVHREGESDVRIIRLDDLQEQIESQMQDMRKRLGDMEHGFTWATPDFGGSFRGSSSGSIVENDKKLSWTVEEDGRVKVTTQDGKDAPERTFEAKSLEELRKEHPEVAKRIDPILGRSGRSAFAFRAPDIRMPGLRGRIERDPDGRLRIFDVTPSTPVLGVEWSPVTDVLREQLDLPSGGIVIESVVAESLAEKLGVAKHDVLLELQGKSVDGSVEVRKALEDAKAGDKVTALVVRKGLKKALETVK